MPHITSKIKSYWELTKPDITLLILMSTFLGYFLGMQFIENPLLNQPLVLLHLMLGSALTSAGVAILNEYIEREQDAKMNRTLSRPLPSGRIVPKSALIFGIVVSVIGVLELAFLVNLYCGILSFITITVYLFVYTPIKQKSPWNTLIGAIPGALPPVGGWLAATDILSYQTCAIFCVFFFWQIPHFLSLAYMYADDYKKGGFIMLPSIYSNQIQTRIHMIFFTLSLISITFYLYFNKNVGDIFFIGNLLLSIYLIYYVINFSINITHSNAKKLFLVSIVYLPVLLILVIVNS